MEVDANQGVAKRAVSRSASLTSIPSPSSSSSLSPLASPLSPSSLPPSRSLSSLSSSSSPPESSLPPSPFELLAWREDAVLRSLAWVRQLIHRCRQSDWGSNGGDIVFLYRFLINRCQGAVRDAAQATVDAMLVKWERSDLSILDAYPESERLQNYVEAMHAKVGLGREGEVELGRMRGKVRAAVARHGVEDICRFNPTTRNVLPTSQSGYCHSCGAYQAVTLRLCPTCTSPLTHPADLDALCESLVWASVYRDVGLHPLELSDATVFLDAPLAFIRHVRPYHSLRTLALDQYRLQCYLITHLLFILSTRAACWYTAPLSRRCLLEEFTFLSHNVHVVIQLDDPELVGEVMAGLRLLGVGDEDEGMRRGYAYLLGREQRGKGAGSWVKSSDSFYTRYHAAYCACIGLAQMSTERADDGDEAHAQWERDWQKHLRY